MIGRQQGPNHIDWDVPVGDTFDPHFTETATGWDGRTWECTITPLGGSPIDMPFTDASTAEALDLQVLYDVPDGVPTFQYLIRSSIGGTRHRTLCFGHINAVDVS